MSQPEPNKPDFPDWWNNEDVEEDESITYLLKTFNTNPYILNNSYDVYCRMLITHSQIKT